MLQKGKILLVDDEPDIREFLSFNFIKEGFEVNTCSNGKDAVVIASQYNPDLIIMDIMMPLMDGIEACQKIRQLSLSNDPIICLLTARSEDYSHLAGIEAGADDYLVKPISLKVLIARMKRHLIRKNSGHTGINDSVETNENIIDRELIIDKDSYIAVKNNKEIQFPKKEFEILRLISSKPNRLFTRDEIYNHIWGTDAFVGDRTMDVYIRKIRSKIGEQYIKTIKGVGYKFILNKI